MNLSSISATSYSTYSTCPYSFKLKYVYKLLIPDNEAFEVGKALHSALQQHHQNFSPDYIIDKLKTQFLTKPINNKKIDNFSTVKKMFELYCKYPLGGTTKNLEYEFRISLPKINCTLHGYMDRVTTDGEVIDYKTTQKDYTTKDANTIQAEIYSYAIKNLGSKSGKVVFYIINKNKIKKKDYIPQVITIEPDTSKLVDKLAIFYKDVMDNKYNPIKGIHCNWCLFRDNCKYYKICQ